MKARTAAFLAAGVLSPVLAQEMNTSVNDRLEPNAELVPVLSEKDQRADGLELHVLLATAYDDNIFLSKSNAQSDYVVRVGPSIAYTKGQPRDGSGGFVQFAYRPTAVAYAEHSSENRVDQDAALTAGWKGKTVKTTYTGGIRKLGDATADTGRQTDRIEIANELRVAWSPREKVVTEFAVGHTASDYADPKFIDSNETYGEAAVRYAYSPKTALGVVYRAGQLHIGDAGKQTTQQLAATMDWLPREKIRVAIKAGAEHRQTDNGSDAHPIVQARVEWQPRQETKIYISGYQREETSAYLAGQNYTVKGATAGVSQRLGDKWTARLEGGAEAATYSQVAGTGTAGRKDKIWFVRPALEYQFNDKCNLFLYYRMSDNSSSDKDFGYRQQTIGLGLDYQF